TVVSGTRGSRFLMSVRTMPLARSAGRSICSDCVSDLPPSKEVTVTFPDAASIVTSIGLLKEGPFWIRWSLTRRNSLSCVNTAVSSESDPSRNLRISRLVTRPSRRNWIRSPSARTAPPSERRVRKPWTRPSGNRTGTVSAVSGQGAIAAAYATASPRAWRSLKESPPETTAQTPSRDCAADGVGGAVTVGTLVATGMPPLQPLRHLLGGQRLGLLRLHGRARVRDRAGRVKVDHLDEECEPIQEGLDLLRPVARAAG